MLKPKWALPEGGEVGVAPGRKEDGGAVPGRKEDDDAGPTGSLLRCCGKQRSASRALH